MGGDRGASRRQQVLDFVRAFAEQHGYQPSIREIGKAVGLKSTSSVAHHLKTLEEAGRLRRGKGPRTVTLTSPDQEAANANPGNGHAHL